MSSAHVVIKETIINSEKLLNSVHECHNCTRVGQIQSSRPSLRPLLLFIIISC